MRLKLVIPADKMASVMNATDTVNDQPWGGFGPGVLRCQLSLASRRPDLDWDATIDFDVDVSGTADSLAIAPRLGATAMMLHPCRQRTDFAALFGDDPQFE